MDGTPDWSQITLYILVGATGTGGLVALFRSILLGAAETKFKEAQAKLAEADKRLSAQIEGERDQREHSQDIEDQSLSALAAHNVTVTSQLVQITGWLTEELIETNRERLKANEKLHEDFGRLHQVELRDEAQIAIIARDMMSVSEALRSMEQRISRIEYFLESRKEAE